MKIRPDLVLDLAGVAGVVTVAAGLWWIYPPAAVIFSGLAIVAVVWVIAKLWVKP
jgi:hypothetical protein